jgi:Ca2+/Na+ antiporter
MVQTFCVYVCAHAFRFKTIFSSFYFSSYMCIRMFVSSDGSCRRRMMCRYRATIVFCRFLFYEKERIEKGTSRKKARKRERETAREKKQRIAIGVSVLLFFRMFVTTLVFARK